MDDADPYYREALSKAEVMMLLLQDFFGPAGEKLDEEKRKIKIYAAMMLKDEIEMMGFPVDYMVTYFYPYQNGHQSRVSVGVTVHRPPKNGTPEEHSDYDRWYKRKMGLNDDQSKPPTPEPGNGN